MKYLNVVFLALLLISSSASGQNPYDSLISKQKVLLKKLYSEEVSTPRQYINGKEYEPYYRTSIFKPLLHQGKNRSATLITNSQQFENIEIQYDTYLDEIFCIDTSIIMNFMYPQITFNKNIVRAFNLCFEDDTLYFINIDEGKGLKKGFYERAYEGSVTFLIKHRSTYYERDAIVNYRYSPVFLISTGNDFIPVKTNRELLTVLNDQSDAIREFLHKSDIRIRKADKNQIIRILRLYESLRKTA